MARSTHKQQQEKERFEQQALNPILKINKIDASQIIKCESPDFMINCEGRVIGVEIVRFSSGNKLKIESDLKRIFQEYEKYLKQNGINHLQINIKGVPMDTYVTDLSRAKLQEDIFTELDRHLFQIDYIPKCLKLQQQGKYDYNYIKDIECFEDKSLDTKINFSPIYLYSDKPPQSIDQQVISKNTKLSSYKLQAKNQCIYEYWLVVHIPIIEGDSADKFYYDNLIENQYARIYVTTTHQDCRRVF